MSEIEFVVGGTRSGKSRYAQQRAEASGKNLVFVATGQSRDQEMLARIERHQKERDDRWTLVEEPLDIATIIRNARGNDCLLVDCLTLWVTNWLLEECDEEWKQQRNAFLEALTRTPATVTLVTNEVGMGVTPMGELSRRFVDESGALHQAIAEVADTVTLVVFGLPQKLK